MSFALILAGLVMIVSAVRGTQQCLVYTVEGDFSGPGNFFYWLVALLIVGALGYSETFRPISTGLLVLILIALFVTRAKNGLFSQLMNALGSSNVSSVGAGQMGVGVGGLASGVSSLLSNSLGSVA